VQRSTEYDHIVRSIGPSEEIGSLRSHAPPLRIGHRTRIFIDGRHLIATRVQLGRQLPSAAPDFQYISSDYNADPPHEVRQLACRKIRRLHVAQDTG